MPEADAAALSRSSRQSAIRSAILHAGRGVVERFGVSDLSLSAVATEVNLNPSTVFGLFRNKDDLLLAILAEDLGTLAAAMRAKTGLPHTISAFPSVSPGEGEDTSSPASDHLCAGSDHAEESAALPSNDTPASLAQQPGDGSADQPSVGHSIEQGVLLLDHAIVNVEAGIQAAEATAARALALSEESMKTVFDRMESFERQQKDVIATLMQRVEEAERRQRGVTSELRTAINDSATRIEMLESAKRARQGRLPTEADDELGAAPAPSESQEPRIQAQPNSGAYRAAAERASSAAATLVALDTTAPLKPATRLPHLRIRMRKRHWVFGACSIALTFALGGSIAFSLGEVHGHQLATGPSHIRTEASHGSSGPNFAASGKAAPTTLTADAKAELLLGLRYLRGQGIAPDAPKAAELMRRAAEQHQPLAEYWLGSLYEHGEGVAANAQTALRWYQAAALQGNRKAIHAVGVAYAQGTGTAKNYSEAARWFTKAAQLGLVNSEFNLAVLFERGLGVPQSLTNAYRWYAIAAAQGDQESRARIEALKTQLKPGELAAAERSAAAFHPLTPDPRANEPPASANLAFAH